MRRISLLPLFAVLALTLVAAPVLAGGFTTSPLTAGQTSTETYTVNATTITQSVSPVLISGNSVSCNNGIGHTNNSYMRRFDLNGAHGIVTPFTVTQVDFGIEFALGAALQPMSVRLYTIPNAAGLLFANLTLIGSANFNVPAGSLYIVSAAVGGTVINPNADDLVVELFTPDGQAVGNLMWVGSNNLGQTAPTYLAAADCGVPQPTDTAVLGFPGMHLVMYVHGNEAPTATAANSWGRIKILYR